MMLHFLPAQGQQQRPPVVAAINPMENGRFATPSRKEKMAFSMHLLLGKWMIGIRYGQWSHAQRGRCPFLKRGIRKRSRRQMGTRGDAGGSTRRPVERGCWS